MPDFAEWLSTQKDREAGVRDLNAFAVIHGAAWPKASNTLNDYLTAVAAEPNQAQRDKLLVALGQNYERWFQQERSKKIHPGTSALFLAGILIGSTIVYSVFFNMGFLSVVGEAKNARGLITFLFAFGTIAIGVVVAVAVFWVDATELEIRFSKAKDLLTILIGILGTIIGFYFGAATSTNRSMSISGLTLSQATAAPGDSVTASTTVVGGISPYKYDLLATDPSRKIDTNKITLKEKVSATGDISEQIQVPLEVSPPATLALVPLQTLDRDV